MAYSVDPVKARPLPGNLAAVMKTMGHKDVRAATQYQHPELEMVRAALNQGEKRRLVVKKGFPAATAGVNPVSERFANVLVSPAYLLTTRHGTTLQITPLRS